MQLNICIVLCLFVLYCVFSTVNSLLTSQNFRSAEEIVQDEDYGDKPASLQQQIDRLTNLCQSMLHRDQNPANLQPSSVGMFLIRFGLSFKSTIFLYLYSSKFLFFKNQKMYSTHIYICIYIYTHFFLF